MNNFWLQLRSPTRTVQDWKKWSHDFRESVLRDSIIFKKKFRWLATCYGPGAVCEALVRIDRRPFGTEENGLGPITMTFFDAEPVQKEFHLVVLSVHDGIGWAVERWVLGTQIKKMTHTPGDESQEHCDTWVFELDTQLLRYQYLYEDYDSYEKRYKVYQEEMKVYHEAESGRLLG